MDLINRIFSELKEHRNKNLEEITKMTQNMNDHSSKKLDTQW